MDNPPATHAVTGASPGYAEPDRTEPGHTEPDPSDLLPIHSFGYRLWMLRHAWTRRMEAALAPTGLTHMQFFMLRATQHLTGAGLVPSQTHIADGLHIDRMTVSKVVRTLEAKCLLTRAVHPDDPRAKGVALTPEGRAVITRATRLAHAEQERFFGRLGPGGKSAFSDALDALLRFEGLQPGPVLQPCPLLADTPAAAPHEELT